MMLMYISSTPSREGSAGPMEVDHGARRFADDRSGEGRLNDEVPLASWFGAVVGSEGSTADGLVLGSWLRDGNKLRGDRLFDDGPHGIVWPHTVLGPSFSGGPPRRRWGVPVCPTRWTCP